MRFRRQFEDRPTWRAGLPTVRQLTDRLRTFLFGSGWSGLGSLG
jgi:hypothetical protein